MDTVETEEVIVIFLTLKKGVFVDIPLCTRHLFTVSWNQ